MSDSLKEFPEFFYVTHKALLEAVLTDIDVLLTAEMGLLLGAKNKRLNAAGKALGAYLVMRRSNQIAQLFARVITAHKELPAFQRYPTND